uniref:Tubulin-specific chaperone E n=1 Tax=Meloidogyne floridensis TaxID=298350 RepID=A0A915NSC6_9BILA
MECKYFSQNESKEFCFCSEEDNAPYIIDIFGTSPCIAARERVLELLVLDNLGISSIGCTQRLISLAHRVTELDLSFNRLDWLTVGKLLETLPLLSTLNLGYNTKLCGQIDGNELPKANKLSTLILNGLSLSFSTLQTIFNSAPSLRVLHLSKTQFPYSELNCSDLEKTTKNFISKNLEELHLNDCEINNWHRVLNVLFYFPKLESLFLADNPLISVHHCQKCNLQTNELTKKLRVLSLSNTKISSWQSIENLLSLKQLEELKLINIPLLKDYSIEERLHLVIGRLRNLKILNGSHIDNRQHEESERFFIRFYSNSDKKPSIYSELVEKHGMLEQLVKVDLTPKRYAKVVIHCEECEWVRMLVKLRLSGTVLELMKFLERLMRIFYVDKQISALGPEELRFPNQELKLLHIEDDDEFFIQSKLPQINLNNHPTNTIKQISFNKKLSSNQEQPNK